VKANAGLMTDPEIGRQLGWLREYRRHLWVVFDLAGKPGTDASIARSLRHRLQLRRLAEELGAKVEKVARHVVLDEWRDTPGKAWPFPTVRHREDCDATDGPGCCCGCCTCPKYFDWEPE